MNQPWAGVVVRRAAGQHGLAVQPEHWIVARVFSWLGRSRRPSK